MDAGQLLGIARHDRPKAPIETLEHARVTQELGVVGDFRGATKPGSKRRRQITIMAAEDWQAAIDELKVPIEWHHRRVNLLCRGVVLPRIEGALIGIGASVVIEVTGECDPCSRMDTIEPGLKAVLLPGWRGGRIARVVADGEISIGDEVRILKA